MKSVVDVSGDIFPSVKAFSIKVKKMSMSYILVKPLDSLRPWLMKQVAWNLYLYPKYFSSVQTAVGNVFGQLKSTWRPSMFKLHMKIYFFPGILECEVMSSAVMAKSWEQNVVKYACEIEPVESHQAAKCFRL